MESSELKELVENYWPNQEVLRAVEEINLVGTVGATASGKTTVMEAAIRLHKPLKMQLVLSDVSRASRPSEVDGINYFFRDKEKMVDGIKRGIYVQVALMPDGGIYATRPESYPAEGFGTLAIMSHVVSVFRRLPFNNMRSAFIVPSSYESWQKWLARQAKQSGWSDERLKLRLGEATASYEFALADEWMRFILNDEPEKAGKRLLQVASGETPEMEQEARELAQNFLDKLKRGTPKL